MITEIELDRMKIAISKGESPTLYYIAHLSEIEDINDEAFLKSKNEFTVTPVKVLDIENCFMEYKRFSNNPDGYKKIERAIYGTISKDSTVISFYTSINGIKFHPANYVMKYDIVPTVPLGNLTEYTNNPRYLGEADNIAKGMVDSGELAWKYEKLESPVHIDDVDFYYRTTNYYNLIMSSDWFGRYMPVISPNEKNCFFLNLEDALVFAEQMRS